MHSLLLPSRFITAIISSQTHPYFPSQVGQPQPYHRPGSHQMLGNLDAKAESSNAILGLEIEQEASPLAQASLDSLAVQCAVAVADAEWNKSIQLIKHLRQRSSPDGDSLERVVTHFVDSLSARVFSELGDSQTGEQQLDRPSCISSEITDAEIQAAYLSFNQVTPFIRFTHLTANQAILEAFQGHGSVHIVDMNIMQGVQWPLLMQALAGQAGGAPRIRISGLGSNLAVLEQTGNLLTTFAASLGLPMFEFRPLYTEEHNIAEILSSSGLDIRPGDSLAINLSIPQDKLSSQDPKSFVAMIRSLEPIIVTLVDRELNCSQGGVMETFKHYCALFDSLEATLPPTSLERSNVERVWLKGEMMSLFPGPGTTRRDSRSQTLMGFQCFKWRDLMRSEGFQAVMHSPFAVSQARLLLRLHYPSQGYQLIEDEGNSLLLGWQGTPLFGVSVWRV